MGSSFVIARIFAEQKKVLGFGVCVCVLGVIVCHLGRSMAGAHMQSVRTCAVETNFSIFVFVLKTAPKQVTWGSISTTIFDHNLHVV